MTIHLPLFLMLVFFFYLYCARLSLPYYCKIFLHIVGHNIVKFSRYWHNLAIIVMEKLGAHRSKLNTGSINSRSRIASGWPEMWD